MRALLQALVLIAVVGAAGGGAWLLSREGDPAEGSFGRDARAAVAVEVAPVERATIREFRTFTGTLHAAARFDVAPKIGGRLVRLEVDLGDRVEQDQVIARLDDDEYVQELEQARAELEVARAGLAEAQSANEARERQYDRIRQLREQRVASQQELDEAEAEAKAQRARVRLALAQVAQRDAALRAAEVRLDYTTIRASWQGDDPSRVVGERFVDEGTTLSANTPIVSVLDIERLVAGVFVAERDYPRLGIGQAATVMVDAFAERTFPATILRIAPLFRETSRQARVELEVPNPESLLKPGMFVRVRVQLDQADDAVVVPLTAVIEHGGETGVFAVDRSAGTARFVPVTLGIVEGERAEIRAPALDGEVVTLGQHLLEDGAEVILPAGATSAAAPEARRSATR